MKGGHVTQDSDDRKLRSALIRIQPAVPPLPRQLSEAIPLFETLEYGGIDLALVGFIHIALVVNSTFYLESPLLFRYFSPIGVDTLRSLRLKATPPNEFNDPFEFLPRLNTNFSRTSVVKKFLEPRTIRSIWKEANEGESYQAFFERYKSAFNAKGKRHVSKVMRDLEENAKRHRDGISAFMGKDFALVCYSEIPDDVLMWAHYTDSHKGFVIGLDAKHPFFRRGAMLAPVVYTSERVPVSYDETGMKFESAMETFWRAKSNHWSYEKEWRQLFPISSCKTVETIDGTRRYFQKLPPKAISTVILGTRCSDITLLGVIDALRSENLSHVRLQKAVLHDRDFRLTIEDM